MNQLVGALFKVTRRDLGAKLTVAGKNRARYVAVYRSCKVEGAGKGHLRTITIEDEAANRS